MTVALKDRVVVSIATAGLVTLVFLLVAQSQWFWPLMTALGIFACAASLTSGHWAVRRRIAVALFGVALVAGSTIPWWDLFLGSVP